MFTVYVFSLLCLLYACINPTIALVDCYWKALKHPYDTPAPTLVTDCHVALNMIPSGTIAFDGVIRKPLHFNLPPNAREPKVLFPAMFCSGHCSISVKPYHREGVPAVNMLNSTVPLEGDPTHDAPSVLYFKTLPAARKAALAVIEKCLPEERTGYKSGVTAILIPGSDGTHDVAYTVRVSKRLPGLMGLDSFDHGINIYDADETGKIRRYLHWYYL